MGLPARRFYPLDEISFDWNTEPRHLLGLGAEDEVQISIRLFGERALLKRSIDGEEVILKEETLAGSRPLFAQDLWSLREHSIVRVSRLQADEPGCMLDLIDGPIEVTLGSVVITAAERRRMEVTHGLGTSQDPSEPFNFSSDCRNIVIAGRQFALSPIRAAIVRVLYEAWNGGTPWMDTLTILETAGSESSRLVDVFGPLEDWSLILRSDNRGNWRLNLPDKPAAPIKRVYRRPLLRIVN